MAFFLHSSSAFGAMLLNSTDMLNHVHSKSIKIVPCERWTCNVPSLENFWIWSFMAFVHNITYCPEKLGLWVKNACVYATVKSERCNFWCKKYYTRGSLGHETSSFLKRNFHTYENEANYEILQGLHQCTCPHKNESNVKEWYFLKIFADFIR